MSIRLNLSFPLFLTKELINFLFFISLEHPLAPARIINFSEGIERRMGDTIDLECKSIGIPSPTTEWKLDQSLLRLKGSSDRDVRIEVLPGGILRISSIRSEDEGNYTCQARNVHGTDTITYSLIVIKGDKTPKSIKLKVEDTTSKSIRIKVEHGHDLTSSDVSDSRISSLRAPLKIFFKNVDAKSEWKQLVINDANPIIKSNLNLDSTDNDLNIMDNTDGSSFVLSNLVCGNNYQIYVEMESMDGTVSTSPILTAKTSGREPLAPPVSVFVSRLNKTTFRLNLNTWSSGGCPVNEARIEYKPSRQKHWNSLNVHSFADPTYLTNLIPDQVYKIKVSMKNDAGSTLVEYEIKTNDVRTTGLIKNNPRMVSENGKMLDTDEMISLSNNYDGDANFDSIGNGNNTITVHILVTIFISLIIFVTTFIAIAILYKMFQKKFNANNINMDAHHNMETPISAHNLNKIPYILNNEHNLNDMYSNDCSASSNYGPASELAHFTKASTIDKRFFSDKRFFMKKMKNSTSDSAFNASYNLNNANNAANCGLISDGPIIVQSSTANYQSNNYATPSYTSSPGYQYLTVARTRNCPQQAKQQQSATLLDAHYAIVSRKDLNKSSTNVPLVSAATLAKHAEANRYTCSPVTFDTSSGHLMDTGCSSGANYSREAAEFRDAEFRNNQELNGYRTAGDECPSAGDMDCHMVGVEGMGSNAAQCGQCMYTDDNRCEWIPPPPESECPLE